MNIRYLAGIVLTLILITGCVQPQPDEVLLPRTEISLTIKGEVVMEFVPTTCQIGYSSERYEFRLVDNKLRDWVIFRSDAKPTDVGQHVNATLEYTSEDSVKTLKGLVFSVEKTAPDGTVWLWNKDKKIGIIIKTL